MANSNYSINLRYTSGDYFAVAIKDPTYATAASTGTFLDIPKFDDTIANTDPAITIVAATNATPIVVTGTTNTFADGDVVRVFGGLVNTGINGTFELTSTGGSGFTLLGSRGNGTYTASSAKVVKLSKVKSPWFALMAACAAIVNDRATNG